MSLRLFLRRIHHLRQFTTPSIDSSFSTTTTQAPLPTPHFSIEYLIKSCGLPSDKAIWASKKIQHLKSADKPDAVLQFLRQTGIRESDIRTSISGDPRILCTSVDKIWRPNVAKLQEVLGSVENLSMVLKRSAYLLHSSLEKVIVPNLSFLEEQCGLSVCQIAQLIKCQPRFIILSTEALKIKAKRADDLGISRSSQMFVYALVVVGSVNQHIIDARLNNLKSLGLSQEEVTILVSTCPKVLNLKEEAMCYKIQFLIKDAGCDKLQLVRNPFVLTMSLEKRLIPRSLVLKLVESKGLPVPKGRFLSFARQTEKRFLEKIVRSYEHAIPGLHRAYTDAVSGKTSAKECFKNISN